MTGETDVLTGKTALVTGGGGFIGSHLCERLVELGVRTHALVRYNSTGSRGWLDESSYGDHIEAHLGDVRDPDYVRRCVRDVDVVFHLASLIGIPYSYRAPTAYVQTNVTGTLNVLEAARSTGIDLVVHTSTSEVYGTAQYVPMDENHPLQGQSPYSATKIGADKLAEAYYRSFDVPVITLRPFNTFGPRQSTRAVIPTVITQAMHRGEIALGNLTPTRDLTFVSDTVEGFVKAAASPEAIGEVVNLGTGREVSIGDLVRTILSILDSSAVIQTEDERLRPESSEVFRLCSDNTKARKLLGWEPVVSLEDGLSRTASWLADNLDRYRADHYAV